MACDIPGDNQGASLTKGDNGVWEVTLGLIDPGTGREHFLIETSRKSVALLKTPDSTSSSTNPPTDTPGITGAWALYGS
jgi:hypothetical protein